MALFSFYKILKQTDFRYAFFKKKAYIILHTVYLVWDLLSKTSRLNCKTYSVGILDSL